MNQNNKKPIVDYLLSDATQVRTVVKIADELDVCPMDLFKFILLPKDHKLKIVEQIKMTLIEGDEVEDVYRLNQANIDARDGMMSLDCV
jgi:hypothetical protein